MQDEKGAPLHGGSAPFMTADFSAYLSHFLGIVLEPEWRDLKSHPPAAPYGNLPECLSGLDIDVDFILQSHAPAICKIYGLISMVC